jgi:hypothetical protein
MLKETTSVHIIIKGEIYLLTFRIENIYLHIKEVFKFLRICFSVNEAFLLHI